MRRQGERDLFKNHPEKLQELVVLRSLPHALSTVALGRHFGCDHTTIIYNLKRFAPHLVGFYGKRTVTRKNKQLRTTVLLLPPAPPKPRKKHPSDKYAHLIEEECMQVNPGHPYTTYLRTSKRKTPEQIARSVRLRGEYLARREARGGKPIEVQGTRRFNI